jgi:hypothetical protein
MSICTKIDHRQFKFTTAYLQKAANALIKTGNLELYERTVEWLIKMQ